MHIYAQCPLIIVHIATGRPEILAISPATPAAGLKLRMPGARAIPTSVRRSRVLL